MARLRVCITINRPPDDVWAYVEQIERHSEWMRDCEAIRFQTAQRRGVGTRFLAVTHVAFISMDDEMEIVTWRDQNAIGVVHSGLVTGRGEFGLRRQRGGRTRFCWVERLHFPRWAGGSFGAWLAVPVLSLIWRGSLRNLKKRLESPA